MLRDFLNNLFQKTVEPIVEKSSIDQKKNGIVAVTFYADKNNTPFVDIILEEYDEDTIKSLCKILDVLSEDGCYLQVVDIIKNAMIKDGEEEKLLNILNHIAQQKNSKLERYTKDKLKDEPCIKPSDMMK